MAFRWFSFHSTAGKRRRHDVRGDGQEITTEKLRRTPRGAQIGVCQSKFKPRNVSSYSDRNGSFALGPVPIPEMIGCWGHPL